MQTNIRRYMLLLMLVLVCILSAYTRVQTQDSQVPQVPQLEQFRLMYATHNDIGVPLVLLDTIKPKKQMFFTEINGGDIEELLKSVVPSKTVNELIYNINSLLPQYDQYTYNIPFKVLQNVHINKQTSQLLIHRDGKMYGFLLNFNHQTGNVQVTGFVLEQDINSYKGLDDIGLHSYPIRNESMDIWLNNDVVWTLKQQADALEQDRGLSTSSFS